MRKSMFEKAKIMNDVQSLKNKLKSFKNELNKFFDINLCWQCLLGYDITNVC